MRRHTNTEYSKNVMFIHVSKQSLNLPKSFNEIYIIFLAVRLGRCPKKDRPSKTSFLYMPRDSTTDLDRQVRTEQMVLTVNQAFTRACEDFNDFSELFIDKDVSMIRFQLSDSLNSNHVIDTNVF